MRVSPYSRAALVRGVGGSRGALAWSLLVASCATPNVVPAIADTAPVAPRAAPDDGDLLGVIPDGAETLLEVDVAQLRGSPWSRPLVATSDDERAAKTAAQGFDELSDVDRAVFAVSEGAAEPTTLTVAQGRFDEGRLARALGAAWTAAIWRGSRLWVQHEQALALLTPRTLLRGEATAVRAAIDCAWGLAADVRRSDAGGLRRDLVAAGDHPAVVAVSVVTEAMRRRVQSQIDLPSGLERAGARLDLGAALDLELVGILATPREAEDAAHNLAITVRDLRARRALAAFGITPFLSGITVAPQGRRVRAHLRVPDDKRADLAAKIAFVLEAIRARAVVPAGGK